MPSQQLVEIILKAQDQASATAKKVDDSIKKIGDSSSRLSRIPGFDGLKTKLSNVATTIDGKLGGALTKIGSKFSSFSSRISTVTSTIKGKFSGAIDGIRSKLSAFGNGVKNAASSMNFLKGAASMAVSMIGYDLVNGVVEAGRAALTARSQFDYFGQRLQKMSGDSKMSSAQLQKLKTDISGLQKEFRKVDMTAVGATAEEIAVKMNLPANKVGDLTRMTAVLSSTFVKEGRTQEDAILAVSDALDGQFKRLQEIGITKDTLIANGWNGNLEDGGSLIDALNKSMKEMGYEQTAKDITSLDEAFGALSIAGGNLLADILIPMTPALIGIMEGVMGLMDGLKGMPDWAIIALGITGVSAALMILIPLLGSSLMSALVSFGSMVGVTIIPEMATLSGALMTVAGAAWAAIAPFLPFIVAAVAVAVAVYEIGKAFGWWTDVGSMIDAIGAGLGRLWNAFINHPDVQAAISMISNALSTLWSWIQQAGQAVLEFFGITTGGQFDIVSALIHGIGDAWNSLKEAVGTVIEALQVFYDFLVSLGEGIQTNLGGLYELFMTVWNGILAYLAPVINQIVSFVQSLINVFNQFRTGQMDLPTFILTVLGMLWNAYNTVLTRIGSYVLKFGTQMLTYAVRAGSNFVRGVIQYIQTLPGRVYSLLHSVVSKVSSAIQAWINTAKSKVATLISNITSPFHGVASAISSALSGVVSAIKAPFEAAYNAVKPILDKIKAGMDMIGGITGAAGFELGNAAGFENSAGFELSDESNVSSTTHHEVLDVNYNINIDLTAPSGMSSNDLMSVVNDRDFLVALTGNRDFQELDARVKSRISLKNSRMRGV